MFLVSLSSIVRRMLLFYTNQSSYLSRIITFSIHLERRLSRLTDAKIFSQTSIAHLALIAPALLSISLGVLLIRCRSNVAYELLQTSSLGSSSTIQPISLLDRMRPASPLPAYVIIAVLGALARVCLNRAKLASVDSCVAFPSFSVGYRVRSAIKNERTR
jgi:hypothetical protein